MAIYKLKDIIVLSKIIKDKTIERKYIDLSSIKSGFYKTLSPLKYPSRAKWEIEGNTILIGRVRPKNRSHGIIGDKGSAASSGFAAFKPNEKILFKYLWYIMNTSEFNRYCIANAKGSTYPEISNSDLFNFSMNIPSLESQQKIIDIIEPKETLFLKFNNCVRIDAVEISTNDIHDLIDIIEPLNCISENVDKQIEIIKTILVSNYNLLESDTVLLSSVSKLHSNKYNEQKKYAATNVFSEFWLNNEKMIELRDKKPSWANLSPIENSFIFSKLKGENKVFFFEKRPDFVISTGFFNIQSDFIDHLSGYFLSKDFRKQKDSKSSGTTMQAINKSNLLSFTIKLPSTEGKVLTNRLVKLITIAKKVEEIKIQQIKLLTK